MLPRPQTALAPGVSAPFMRIISGQRRGHKIDGPRPKSDLRPTSDLVRESLFNMVGPLVVDLDVIDLFAGTGALGLEALSRGARRAVFIEKNRETVGLIHRNIAILRYQDRTQVRLDRRLPMGPRVSANRRRTCGRLSRSTLPGVRDPRPPDARAARHAAGEASGGVGDCARGGPRAGWNDPARFQVLGHQALRRNADCNPRDPGAFFQGGFRGRGRDRGPVRRNRPESPWMAEGEASRDFALEVVQRLRQAGFQALWAGGCVRDLILGRDAVRLRHRHERHSRTGHDRRCRSGRSPSASRSGSSGSGIPGQGVEVEVATFRSDCAYVDGRRPSSVVFSSPELDAARRDFTINGLFLDPMTNQITTTSAASTTCTTRCSVPSAIRWSGSGKTSCGFCARSASPPGSTSGSNRTR